MKKEDGKKFSSIFHERGFYLSAICLIMVLVAIGYFSRLSAVQENTMQKQSSEQNSKPDNVYVYPNGGKNDAVKPITKKESASANKGTTLKKHSKRVSTRGISSKSAVGENIAVSSSSDKKIGQAEPKFTKSSLAYPVVGNILNDYTGDKLVYSKTLDEWSFHGGIDIETELNAQVKAVADGFVEKIYTDNDLGKTVIINHGNGFKTLYANLLDNNMLKAGQEVKKGEIIGGIGKTATSEVAEAAHLHFEMYQNDKEINPDEFLKTPAVSNY